MSFITDIAPHAQRIQKEFGILASLVIAQACLESDYGKSGLAVNGKNLFGIKGAYSGQSVTMATTEYVNGKPVKVNAAFRKYPSWYESLCDLANLYKNGVSWDHNKYKKILGETDYKKAAKAVQSAGYATDPKYADKLIKVIDDNKLTQYDVSKPTQKQPVKFKDGQKVKIKLTAKNYATGQTIPERVKNKQYTIMQIKGDKALIKEIYSWVMQSDLV